MAANTVYQSGVQPVPASSSDHQALYQQQTNLLPLDVATQPPTSSDASAFGQGMDLPNDFSYMDGDQPLPLTVQPYTPASAPSDGSFFCEQEHCDKAFPDKDKLRKHVNQVHVKGHYCCCCGESKGAKKDLHRHYWIHHQRYAEDNKIPKEKGKCPNCGVDSRKDNLKRHMASCKGSR